ncbi:oligopeptidase [Spathaspora passalidarum NRRL Y-27907]|uniref:Oligopeptidase n=1 Tax=Spathaspora passalidarum (strain NRRL Y-27907 / 11-Y1) TaxID=619300 RepID=G3AGL8_SPAPN|nr:oligopeptidase [Spathaspora passalidarum NRRL Y-27907]EGW35358.1 oligopeptidase [Spathaspora passalidarum NRRL Y-27907]
MSIDFEALTAKQNFPLWEQTPEDVLKTANELIEKQKNLFDKIAATEEPTLDNLLKPFAELNNKDAFPESQVTFYQYVSTNKELRDASTKAEELIEESSITEWSRPEVYKVFQKLYDAVKDTDIDPESKRYLKKSVTAFKRNGLALPEETREKIKKLKVELSNLSVQFAKNLNEEKGFVLFTKKELDGVPEDVIGSYSKAEQDGEEKLKVTFKYPDILPLLKHAHNGNTRKTAYIAYNNRCSENAPILEQIIKVRYELGQLLEYDTYSDFVLEERMAKKKEVVLDFLSDLRTKLTPVATVELEELLKLKNDDLKSRGLEPEDKVYAWDSAYYNELLLEKKYSVDNIKIAEYFPLESTVNKMLGFYETIFDIKFVRIEKPAKGAVWHEDVQQFAVYKNIKHGEPRQEFIGWIYFDLHPREGKYGHAANFGLGPGYLEDDGKTRHTPVTALVCNFTKPTPEKPSLLKHDEVTTFFHELGHGIHNIISQTRYARFHGTRVERDFVETPSQMLEYWTWSKDEIKGLSSHYKTGEPIDDDLVDKLIKTKHVNTGIFNLRQLFFGIFDMQVHTIKDKKDLDELDLFKKWNSLREDITLISSDNNPTKGYSSFGHIAGGYESGYYGYLYSLVYAADIYYTLFKKDPMNVESGIRYRDIILTRGGSRDSIDNLKELLGRAPNAQAFLQEIFG